MTFQKGHKINLNRTFSKETKEKLREYRKGKTYEELFGKEKAQKIKKKIGGKMMGENNPSKRPEVITKILNSRKWYKHSNKTKHEIGKGNRGKTWEEIYGKEKAIKMKELQSKRCKEMFSGDKNPSKRPEVKKKLRKAAIKYIKENRGNIYPNIGKNEKKILDELELSLGFKIHRQFEVGGYFIDGYIPKLRLAIEIDEKDSHRKPKTKYKDIQRQKEIKKELRCEFFRIKDY